LYQANIKQSIDVTAGYIYTSTQNQQKIIYSTMPPPTTNQAAGKGIYKSKHAFTGSPSQSQLSFPAGATIIAEIGQSGAWWWGRCNGMVS
jgi:hypothetical protein